MRGATVQRATGQPAASRGATTAQRALAWCAVVSMVGFGIGWVGFAGFLPLPAPWHDPAEIAGIFLGRSVGIRLGAIFMIIGTMFWVPWAAIVAVQIDDDSRAGRALRYTQICSATVGTAVVLVAMLMWVVAAFRTDRDPALVQALSDLGFVIAIMPFAIFAMWNLALSLAIFCDRGERPAFPRWSAYLGIWLAVLYVPGACLAFFHRGAFAWNGLLAFYVPVGAFFVWLMVMTVLTLRSINRVDPVPARRPLPTTTTSLVTE